VLAEVAEHPLRDGAAQAEVRLQVDRADEAGLEVPEDDLVPAERRGRQLLPPPGPEDAPVVRADQRDVVQDVELVTLPGLRLLVPPGGEVEGRPDPAVEARLEPVIGLAVVTPIEDPEQLVAGEADVPAREVVGQLRELDEGEEDVVVARVGRPYASLPVTMTRRLTGRPVALSVISSSHSSVFFCRGTRSVSSVSGNSTRLNSSRPSDRRAGRRWSRGSGSRSPMSSIPGSEKSNNMVPGVVVGYRGYKSKRLLGKIPLPRNDLSIAILGQSTVVGEFSWVKARYFLGQSTVLSWVKARYTLGQSTVHPGSKHGTPSAVLSPRLSENPSRRSVAPSSAAARPAEPDGADPVPAAAHGPPGRTSGRTGPERGGDRRRGEDDPTRSGIAPAGP
jgi:hypothetical protein